MKKLCTLTDKEVLGTEGLSSAEPRYTARAVVQNEDGLYAVLYAEKFGLYSLPGGGIEDGETPPDAVKREVLEETGCAVLKAEALGIVEENRFCFDYTQVNYYYAVTVGNAGAQSLTEGERSARTQVQWHTLEEAAHLIEDTVYGTNQQKYLQARDAAALRAYMQGDLCGT